jgi:hypothetical protein
VATYLAQGRQLECDWTACEAGRLWLRPLANLFLAEIAIDPSQQPFFMDDPMAAHLGSWIVPAVYLVERCEGAFRPEGILVWLPESREFGQWDSEHDVAFRFKRATWASIVQDPLRFLNNRWTLQEKSAKRIVPWEAPGAFFCESTKGPRAEIRGYSA